MGVHVINYPGKAEPYQIGIPKRRAGGTGGREYANETMIARIRRMATFGRFDSEPEDLQKFLPIQYLALGEKPSAPYTLEERMIVVSPFATPFTGTVDTTINIGTFQMSAPIILGEYSYGAMRGNVHRISAEVAERENLLFGVGEGGWFRKILHYNRIMVQIASGVFGITGTLLKRAAVRSKKWAQSAKAGIGGHVVEEKIDEDMANTRGMPQGMDYISDANRAFSIEEVRQLEASTRIASGGKPGLSKTAATHDIAAIVAGSIEAGDDGIIIDGRGGGTGAAPNIVKNSSCIPIELAVRIARMQANAMGKKDYKIFAAGRVYLPRKGFKLMLAGANGVMLSSAALQALGCGMVHQCHRRCPALLATKIGDREIDIEWGVHVLSSFLRVWRDELARYAAYYGFQRLHDAVDHPELLRAIAFSPEALALTGFQKAEGFEDVEKEMSALWERTYEDAFHGWQHEHNKSLRETGTTIIGSMGRTTDLDPPKSYLDAIIVEGRHVVGPSYDPYRDAIETVAPIAGNIRLDAPFIISTAQDDKNTLELLKTAVSRRTVARITDSAIESLSYDRKTKSALEKRISSMLLEIRAETPEEIVNGTNHRILREAAGIIIPLRLLEKYGTKAIRTWTDRPMYVEVESTGKIEEQVVALVRDGIDGIIVNGKIGRRQFSSGTYDQMPLELAIPAAHDALTLKLKQGIPLRNKVVIIAKGNLRTPDDAFKLLALGANAVESVTITELAENDGNCGDALRKLFDGYGRELQVLMGAGGISGHNTLVGNRDLLRSDEMPAEAREMLGIKFMGE